MNRLFTLAGTSLTLIALYLLLRNAFGATSLLREAGATTVAIFKTLQGR